MVRRDAYERQTPSHQESNKEGAAKSSLARALLYNNQAAAPPPLYSIISFLIIDVFTAGGSNMNLQLLSGRVGNSLSSPKTPAKKEADGACVYY